jgi:glycosyltransferase involved in cell wall biosynthesis
MIGLFNKLQAQVAVLSECESVELLVLMDNCSKSIADKRNDLLRSARGKYIAFLDDDDDVGEDYIDALIGVIDSGNSPDCITFKQHCLIDGDSMIVNFGIGHPHGELVRDQFGSLMNIKRPPYHMCLWRRELALSEQFNSVYGKNGQSTEDIDWLLRLYPKIKSEIHIDAVLHRYIYSSKTTASLIPRERQ